MDPMSILFPVLSVGGMGVVFGACLGVASEVFKVEEDLVSVRFWNVCPALTAVVVVSRLWWLCICNRCRYSSCKCLPCWWRSSC